jgi:beta-galactosidase GanA
MRPRRAVERFHDLFGIDHSGKVTAMSDAYYIGASWYPEMWPESQWLRDVEGMRELNFNIVRLFEFAWHRFEPSDGVFDFDWARRILDLCNAAGISVMVGTPTAAPPAWLTSAHPDTLRVDADGRRLTHGQRKHYSVYIPTYRQFCRRIVARLVDAVAGHPAIHSWQIDNEMDGRDFSDQARSGFHEWLEARYGTVEGLNQAWGLEFWSQAYSRFDQVPFPTASVGSTEIPERHHPSLIFDAARYYNDAWTGFIEDQCNIVRSRSDKPISSNMTPGMQMNWFQHNRVLDRVGASIYKDVEHYHWTTSIFDRMRAEKPVKPYWLLETAPSWSAAGRIWNIHHDERGVAAITWLGTLLGGEMTLYWQWRSHWAGQEMQHGTLVTATGDWAANARPIGRLAAQLHAQADWLAGHPPVPAKIGLMLCNESAWGFSIDPIEDGLRYDSTWRDDFHLPLFQRHWWRDVIGVDANLDQYDVILMPMMPVVPTPLRERLVDWVRGGGRLLLGPLTGTRTEQFTQFTDRTFGGLEELMGGRSAMRFTSHWVEDRVTLDFDDDLPTRIRGWCEAFDPTTATPLARYSGGYGDGLCGALRHRFGSGEVLTIGCRTQPERYVRLAESLFFAAGIRPVAGGSGHVCVVPRAGGVGLVNLSEQSQTVTLDVRGVDRLTGVSTGSEIELAPLAVVLIETG